MKTSTFSTFLLLQNPKKTGLSSSLCTMKKLLLLISFAAPMWSMAQSATILPDGVNIPKVSVLPACSTSEKGNQVFNSTVNKMYYCNGTSWQEMTGGGFTLPYSGAISSPSPLLYLENTGGGRAIHAKSTSVAAIKGESEIATGIWGMSESYYGVYALSTSGVGIYGSSSSNSAGYFESYGTEPTLYVSNNGLGAAANFKGNVKIQNELTVDDNKGIVRSNTSTQVKIVRLNAGFTVNSLAVGDFKDSGNLNYEDFGGIPTVTVGQVLNASATGEWYKVMIIPINVTATECQFRIVNLSSNVVSMSANWQIFIIGPE